MCETTEDDSMPQLFSTAKSFYGKRKSVMPRWWRNLNSHGEGNLISMGDISNPRDEELRESSQHYNNENLLTSINFSINELKKNKVPENQKRKIEFDSKNNVFGTSDMYGKKSNCGIRHPKDNHQEVEERYTLSHTPFSLSRRSEYVRAQVSQCGENFDFLKIDFTPEIVPSNGENFVSVIGREPLSVPMEPKIQDEKKLDGFEDSCAEKLYQNPEKILSIKKTLYNYFKPTVEIAAPRKFKVTPKLPGNQARLNDSTSQTTLVRMKRSPIEDDKLDRYCLLYHYGFFKCFSAVVREEL